MNIVFNLRSLPELQHLDKQRRGRAILDWRIALWKSWATYFFELGILCGVIAIFKLLWHFIEQNNHWPWYSDFIWIVPASLTAVTINNHLIYLRRRDVLAKILKRSEYVE